MALSSSYPLHSVVSIFSPVKIALLQLSIEAHLLLLRHGLPPSCNANNGLWHYQPRRGDRPQHLGEVNRPLGRPGRPRIGTRALTGKLSGCLGRVETVRRNPTWSLASSPKTQDASRADIDPSAPYVAEGLQSLVGTIVSILHSDRIRGLCRRCGCTRSDRQP